MTACTLTLVYSTATVTVMIVFTNRPRTSTLRTHRETPHTSDSWLPLAWLPLLLHRCPYSHHLPVLSVGRNATRQGLTACSTHMACGQASQRCETGFISKSAMVMAKAMRMKSSAQMMATDMWTRCGIFRHSAEDTQGQQQQS